MYIMITNRCNLHCDHCCGDYTDVGRDMSLETFKAACEIAEYTGSGVFLGGGEPTLHPLFEQFLGMAVLYGAGDGCGSGLITNGTNRELTERLINAKENGTLGSEFFLAVSAGELHGYPEIAIPEAYIREDPDIIHRIGRAAKTWHNHNWEEARYGCICSSLQVRPSGAIYACGCPDAPILGTVKSVGSRMHLIRELDSVFACYRDDEFRERLMSIAETDSEIAAPLLEDIEIRKARREAERVARVSLETITTS